MFLLDLINKTIEIIKNTTRTPTQMRTAVQKLPDVESVLPETFAVASDDAAETETVGLICADGVDTAG